MLKSIKSQPLPAAPSARTDCGGRRGSRHLFLTALSLIISSSVFAADANTAMAVPDPDTWYRTSYGPLWNDKPADNVEAILDHYAKTIVTHATDGPVTHDEQKAWLAEPMKEWVAEGWLRAELTALETTRINATTAAFTATWKDFYKSGEAEVSCGWYLADYLQGEWLITEYADTPCPE